MTEFQIPERAKEILGGAAPDPYAEPEPAPEQQSLTDPLAALAATDEAVKRVEDHADPAWKSLAIRTVRYVCERREFFTADDLWEAGLPEPREPRAIGPVMRRAQTAGLCEQTGRQVPSQIPGATDTLTPSGSPSSTVAMPERGYLLAPADRRRAEKRDDDECIETIRGFLDDPYIGPSAVISLDLIENHNGHPGLLAVLLEKAAEGEFLPTKAESDRQRHAQKGDTNGKS